MIGIGIETTCDDTSIGIVRNGTELLSVPVFSQTEYHAKYRGVVPEIASRAHVEKINYLLDCALTESNVSLSDLNYVSVSSHPGLMGSLIVGAQMAKSIAMVYNLPIIALNHLEAHLNVIRLEDRSPSFPYLGVLLSGGNSSIYVVQDFGQMHLLGDTMDDALGEAFDKVASLLELPYPGGPEIERLATSYESNEKSLFPELLKDSPVDKIVFSYSGIKTSVMYYLKKTPKSDRNLHQICYHFQNTAFQLVEKNIWRAIKLTGIREVVCGGGVLANSTLRKKLIELSIRRNFKLYFPDNKKLCTDNGAMVASLGYFIYKKGQFSPLDFKLSPNT